MVKMSTNNINEQAKKSAKLCIDRIKRGVYHKDFLVNSSEDFTGDNEHLAHILYLSYLNSITYNDLSTVRGEVYE
jgi:hypothetical protein